MPFYSTDNIVLYLIECLVKIPGALFVFTLRGFCQAFSSDRLGDPTPRNQGKLSFNPMKHIDIVGFICILLFGMGWSKPVMVNSRYYKNIKRDSAIQILSGPIGCIVGGFLMSFIFVLVCGLCGFEPNMATTLNVELGWQGFVAYMFLYAMEMCIYLGLFFLLPIPGFDGFRLIANFLPPRAYSFLYKVEKYSLFIFLGVILLLNTTIGSLIIGAPAVGLINLFVSLWRNVFFFLF